MCTSIFTETDDTKHFLARTMDFPFPLEAVPIYLPRNFHQELSNNHSLENKYGFVGSGRKLDETYIFADGINEEGLAIAELYLPGESVYNKGPVDGKINIAPWEFINWVLGNFKTINELDSALNDVRLIEKKAPLINELPPLHFIIGDVEGNLIIIEPKGGKLEMQENPVGILTNTPTLDWHIENLRNYTNIRPNQFSQKKYGLHITEPSPPESGTLGIPGGYTPFQRFVRSAFIKEHIKKPENEDEMVSNAWKILNSVYIPKGIIITDYEYDYHTQYVAGMSLETKTYYFTLYENDQINKIEINDELLKNKEPKVFDPSTTQNYNILDIN